MTTRGSAGLSRLLFVLVLVSAVRGQQATLVEKEGQVVVTKVSARPEPAAVGTALVARDKLGTGESSRAVLRMSEKWFARVDEETDIEITPGALGARSADSLRLALGGAFVFSREEKGELKIQTPSATGGLRGTQLVVRVDAAGKTTMQVLEGEVDLANDFGRVQLRSGEAGEAEVGHAPRKTAVIETRNLLQWALYYPAVLVPEELGLASDEQSRLAASLEAYRAGSLLDARDLFPASEPGRSEAAGAFKAAVLLATGRVEAARTVLRDVPRQSPGRAALERMIAAVLGSDLSEASAPQGASGWLAESYFRQSRHDLEAARTAARRATELAPRSGYAWERLAELEFSFGRTREALRALDESLRLSPRNAQAHALRGFALSAENRIGDARAEFQQTVALDGGLGNGWLGLGLTKIKQGDLAAGQSDLQTAATVEPTRAFLYSYDGKALNLQSHDALARKDFDLARQIDPQDPTPWLYSAIQTQQGNRYNEAIGDMERSIELNGNRRVYRSQFLLDQDSAVRSANLAKIYQNDGMTDLSVREATRAVDSDYANASAHLFLADSYYALIDPKRISLRYQTAWFNELLLANLLSPVGGGPLSQFVSQQEYSKLLSPDGAGGSTVTEWRSGGYFDSQNSVFGSRGRASAGLDFLYHKDPGTRPNNDDTRKELWGQAKFQVTADDTVYTLLHWRDQKDGDLFQTYADTSNNPGYRYEDRQAPGLALAGWNHRWAPGWVTLFLGGRLDSDQTATAPNASEILLQRDPSFFYPGFIEPAPGGGLQFTDPVLRNANPAPVGFNADGSLKFSPAFLNSIAPFLGRAPVSGVYSDRFNLATERRSVAWTAELEQIWQTNRNTLLAGGRWQSGWFNTTDRLDLLDVALKPYFPSPAALQNSRVGLRRESVYAYDYFSPAPWLTLVGGGSWDRLEHPADFRFPPVSDRKVVDQRANAKAGFTFKPAPWLTVRGAYTEVLGGVALDEDVRLEPVQFAGFSQTFRTIISESIASSVEAPVYKNKGLSVEGRLPTRTWWGASLNELRERVDRTVGAFDVLFLPAFPVGLGILPASTTEALRYREVDSAVGVNQLAGDNFAFGVTYHHTRAELRDVYTQVPATLLAAADQFGVAALDQVTLGANWNSPTGWFVRAEADWYRQWLEGVILGTAAATTPGDNFWQANLEGGFRFHHNLREISVGVLNLGDRDYHFSPLDNILEPPRARTIYVRCRAAF